MADESRVLEIVRRYSSTSARTSIMPVEIYHDDAVLEFPSQESGSKGVATFTEWRRQYPGRSRQDALPPPTSHRAGRSGRC